MTTHDARSAWGCCAPSTPYQRGIEDASYSHIYANPHRHGCPAWVAYDRGNQDARAATRPEVQP